jgi:hypothetical protein
LEYHTECEAGVDGVDSAGTVGTCVAGIDLSGGCGDDPLSKCGRIDVKEKGRDWYGEEGWVRSKVGVTRDGAVNSNSINIWVGSRDGKEWLERVKNSGKLILGIGGLNRHEQSCETIEDRDEP